MKLIERFPKVTLSFPLTQWERKAILRLLDQSDADAVDLINRSPQRQPLVLIVEELYNLAGLLAAKCLHTRSPSRLLVKLVERMDRVIGEECGLRPRQPVASPKSEKSPDGHRIRNILLDGTEDHSGHQLIAEMQAVLRARLKGPVELLPDFKLSATAKRTMRRSPRPPA